MIMLGRKLPENWLPLTIALSVMTLAAMIVVLNLGPDPEPITDSGGPLVPRPPDSQRIPPPDIGLIGETPGRNHLTIRAGYRPADAVNGQAPPAGSTRLEVDVYAEVDNPQAFPSGTFVPYLQLSYRLEPSQGGRAIEEGPLRPTVTRQGIHYGATIRPTPGNSYRLVLRIAPPGPGVDRATDDSDGVDPWWEPFTLAFPWDFTARTGPNP